MEVKKAPNLASQFWPKFIKGKIVLVILTQIVISLLFGVILVLTDAIDDNPIWLWVIAGCFLVIQLAANIFILILSTRPTKDLLATIINVAGEQPTLPLPNPNTTENEQTGFRDALQTIYELAASKDQTKADEKKKGLDQKMAIITSALDMTKCGFIALDKHRKVVYANKTAPIHTDSHGEKVIDLIFNGSDTLNAWLDGCEANAVHDEHIWTRIPDHLPNEEGRRFFDVIASYQKGSASETVITMVDRTSSYIVDEENLDFISFAAHELRGPITVIKGYLDVLEDELSDVLTDDQPEMFHRLVVSSNRLSGYIDNILNTSRYDRRHLKMNLSEESVAAIYDTISDDMKLRAGAQNRLLTVDFPANLPTIAADRASMGEVLGNLIDNAIKYSNEGGVIKVNAKANGDFVDISVVDNGIGMPESVVSQLFQKFYRSHRSRETVAGSGIGLYISKAIVESHGGQISVRSEDGHGSTFTVSLPIYATVADKLKAGDNSNEGLINEGNGWIKNHSMYRS
ncbi:MAG TPA: HAMP domain-containing sensor histidine kinase [Candidatus Saccharimonadales bacterium]|nr:HAMP domain-containing sensor histidine kinase [Candidatus Saccharimonadales bacterium]